MKKSIEFKLAASRSDRKSLVKLLDKGKDMYNLALCRCTKLLNGIRADKEYGELLDRRRKLKRERKSTAEVDSHLQKILEPQDAKHRIYEALRAYFVEGRKAQEVARTFGYSVGSFHVLCHHFRRDPDPVFFVSTRKGPRSQPKKSAARDMIIELRKRNHSVYEISETLKERNCPLSATAVREVLKAEGFGPLPRRLDEERPDYPVPR